MSTLPRRDTQPEFLLRRELCYRAQVEIPGKSRGTIDGISEYGSRSTSTAASGPVALSTRTIPGQQRVVEWTIHRNRNRNRNCDRDTDVLLRVAAGTVLHVWEQEPVA
jgi:hypothetical protein